MIRTTTFIPVVPKSRATQTLDLKIRKVSTLTVRMAP